MTEIIKKTDTSSKHVHSDCSPFLNWEGDTSESSMERAVLFRSLVATLQLQPALDASVEARAVKLLESVHPPNAASTDDFLFSLARNTGNSSPDFVQSIIVLISSPSHVITNAAMQMLNTLIWRSSPNILLALIKAGLIPQLVVTLDLQSLSFTEAVDIHINLILIITRSFWLATPFSLEKLRISDENEQQAVHETVLKKVLTPSETYICHLCVNRFSIIDGKQSKNFVDLLTRLLKICPNDWDSLSPVSLDGRHTLLRRQFLGK
ncbi:hypothetical protein BLNAU_22555 [Blattamonas nauphoetae]|uniref:Uncharacterized protein n=1 Tax=Blattamonas nauphoetae TaxID=2049346 RepID=A0ABQ9WSP9_9EUKA|nr:hypothetical protein BLNAU_22555 [Blattamonas nauphoetae]